VPTDAVLDRREFFALVFWYRWRRVGHGRQIYSAEPLDQRAGLRGRSLHSPARAGVAFPCSEIISKDCLSSKGFARTSPARHYVGMISLTDTQLETVMTAARSLPAEKRDLFLRRLAA
jgi:hypothetical protein